MLHIMISLQLRQRNFSLFTLHSSLFTSFQKRRAHQKPRKTIDTPYRCLSEKKTEILLSQFKSYLKLGSLIHEIRKLVEYALEHQE